MKFLGILLLVFGVLVGLIILTTFIGIFTADFDSMPFLIGQLIGVLLFVGMDFLIIKAALNMINAKKKKLEKIQLQKEIDHIGN